MKRFTKTGILVLGAALVSQLAQAQFTPNDLYVGFVGQGASTNYVINLGGAAGITGSSTVVDLSGDFSTSVFNAIFTSGYNNVSMGVVGGLSSFGNYDLYATATRMGGPGDPAVAGSDLGARVHNSSTLSSAANDLSVVGFPSNAGDGAILGTGDHDSWTLNVAPTLATGSFYGDAGINPMSDLDSSGLVYEDLWMATPSSAYTYLGYFTLDAANSSLTYTPSVAPVPEPAPLSILGGGALLLWCLRWRSVRKNASGNLTK